MPFGGSFIHLNVNSKHATLLDPRPEVDIQGIGMSLGELAAILHDDILASADSVSGLTNL